MDCAGHAADHVHGRRVAGTKRFRTAIISDYLVGESPASFPTADHCGHPRERSACSGRRGEPVSLRVPFCSGHDGQALILGRRCGWHNGTTSSWAAVALMPQLALADGAFPAREPRCFCQPTLPIASSLGTKTRGFSSLRMTVRRGGKSPKRAISDTQTLWGLSAWTRRYALRPESDCSRDLDGTKVARGTAFSLGPSTALA